MIKQLTVFILVVFSFATLLSGCVHVPFRFDARAEDVERVEIYDLRLDGEVAYYHVYMDPVYTVGKDELQQTLIELYNVRFTKQQPLIGPFDPCYTIDGCFAARITYSDGTAETVSPFGNQKYSEDGSAAHYNIMSCDESEWNAFMLSVLPEDIYYSEPSSTIGTFSYAEDTVKYSDKNAKTSGFMNTEPYGEAIPPSYAPAEAMLELNIVMRDILNMEVAYDAEEKIYRVTVYESGRNGPILVYMDEYGVTLLTVYV